MRILPWIVVFILICSYASSDENTTVKSPGDDQATIVFPSTDDGDAASALTATTCTGRMSCVRLSECAIPKRRNNQPKFPNICDWEVREPKVCCIPKRRSTSKPPVPKPENKSKVNSNFSKNECAAMSLNLQVRIESRFQRSSGTSNIAVVGGEDVTTASKWPFVVAILIVLGDDKIFLCGGSLISKNLILAAAHCFDNKIDSDTYVVRMGTVELNPDVGVPLEFSVSEVIVHEDYRPPVLNNDIALLKFVGLSSYSDTVKPVCLPEASIDRNLTSATVVGWGSKEFGGGSSQILQEVSLPVVSNGQCNSTYSSIATVRTVLPNGIIKSHMCAGDVNGTRDACQGDSGGPLVVTDDSLRWTQVGVVSGGIGCGTPGIPGIYTRLFPYVDWIRSKA